jgi:hypothetical protein
MTTVKYPLSETSLVLTADELTDVLKALPRRAVYARDYAKGWKRVSGADLTGKARQYGARYHKSRRVVEALAVSVAGELIRVEGRHGAVSLWSPSALSQELA